LSSDGVKFHDRIARDWTGGYLKGSFRRRLNHLDQLLRSTVRTGETWLDAGCGSGLFARRISELGANVDGVDASASMIAAAQSESEEQPNVIRFQVVESVEKLAFDDGSFDGILCSSVVEYVREPNAVFLEFSRILRPGGTLILSVPNKFSILRSSQKLVKAVTSKIGLDIYPYLSVSINDFRKDEVRELLEKCGLDMISLGSYDPLFSLVGCSTELDSLIFIVAKKVRTP